MINYVVKDNGIIKAKDFEIVDNETVGLKADMYLTEDEVVNDIITNRLDDDNKLYFKGCTKDDLISHHLSFGMWIRNTYALWDKNNPMTGENPDPDSEKHPDTCSSRIMELVNLALNEKYTPIVSDPENNFTEAMKTLGGK